MLYLVLFFLIGFMVGSTIMEYVVKTNMIDIFCCFIRLYGLTEKDLEDENFKIEEFKTIFLLQKLKEFFEIASNDKMLKEIKKDLAEEGR